MIGQRLCPLLQARGGRVRAALRSPAPALAVADLAIIPVIDSHTNWMLALANCTAVIHLAACTQTPSRDDAALSALRELNVNATLNLARQAAAAGVRRFVFVSSAKVNGDRSQPGQPVTEADPPQPLDAYALSKLAAEQGLRALAQTTGMELVIIRPPVVYGPAAKGNFAALVQALRRGWPLPLGALHNRRSLIGVDNLADFIATCLEREQAANQTFLVSDGQDLSTTELVRALAPAMGVRAHMLPVPAWLLQAAGTLLGQRPAMQRLCGNLQLDISKARALLDWTPPVSVAEGLRRAIAMSGHGLPRSARHDHPGGLPCRPSLRGAPRRGNPWCSMKRLFDWLLSLCAGLILLMPMALLALAVRFTSKGPILYWSDRVGRNNVIFKMPKFRSMQVGTPALASHLLPSPQSCLTPIGGFLRQSSLDELPQLWCIVKGEMSFVGPRPALFNQADLIALRTQAGVHQLRPGLTGWAQINGRDDLPISVKAKLDGEYLQRASLAFDFYILLLTALKVVRRDGVAH